MLFITKLFEWQKVSKTIKGQNMEYLDKLREQAKEKYIPIIKDDGCEFLVEFCKQNNFQNILEIGTAVGYSGSKMLLCLQNAHLTTIEIDKEMYDKAKVTFENLNLTNRVTQILGDAKEIIKTLDTKFDFIFMDGPKGQYLAYYQSLLDLLNCGGYILCDNVYFHGLVLGEEFVKHKLRTIVVNMRKFLDFIQNDKRVNVQILDKADGIAIIQKK